MTIPPLENSLSRVNLPPKVRLKRFLVWCLLCGVIAAIVMAALIICSPSLLTVESPVTDCDALVVLGGDTNARPARAVELFREGIAPRIVISGNGDCWAIRGVLVHAGVPTNAIQLECDSTSTKENAEFTVRVLREWQVKSAVIVTSWYHSRRAKSCFERAAPEIAFYSCPARPDPDQPLWLDRYDRERVFLEYGKIAFYWLRYGISPF